MVLLNIEKHTKELLIAQNLYIKSAIKLVCCRLYIIFALQ